MRRRTAAVAVLALTATAAIALSWTTPVRPIAWTPDPSDPAFQGRRTGLTIVRTLDLGPGAGPEDCAALADGRLACGLADGRIVVVEADLSGVAGVMANTGGRPLGITVRGHDVLVADARKGLLRITPDGAVAVLRAAWPEGDLRFADELATTPDGGIWLTDASSRWGQDAVAQEFTERRPTGRLLRLGPDGRGGAVMEGLGFANGVAAGADHVLVAETSRWRILRRWTAGPQAGQSEVFATGLPGSPDNLTLDSHGRLWVALVGPRGEEDERLAGRPLQRAIRFRLQRLAGPKPQGLRPSAVMVFGRDGRLLGLFDVPHPELGGVTTVVPTDLGLVLGTNRGRKLALAAWPALPPAEAPVGPPTRLSAP
ncbi:SMP-30/gluconolactonase/LRE family protein [Phenylobacterium sp. SCN 70-31]|uniref:SMP-30/gluconolactonase/LRE family protein n=1 Tax=Phenylobacterium sp. SCN 70-31 TaxID=1660129 RepID=UPI00086D9C4A|nr:SMP-30/gluconolactonase/LRE family protein [Phenylobacterium sp. SCN 70-31]ODT86129.1 MAG: hypothetical protein ABS78_17500 [Phenylobacterium sp. SCN 70-31]